MWQQVRQWAWWAAPALLCAGLYRLGLRAWFQQDDFAWIGLARDVHDLPGLVKSLFGPMAQGTIRPLSERGYFLVLYHLFGLDALPFRIVGFLTQCASIVLLALVARRLTGSRLAGFLAAALWASSGTLAVAMCWSSAFNQVLCGFLLLLAFYSFLRYSETGVEWYRALEWAAFLAGLGALELMAVYPALVAVYALCRSRRLLREAAPLFLVSGAYVLVHACAAPAREAGSIYGLHFGASLLSGLGTYWGWALGWSRLPEFVPMPSWVPVAGTAVLTASLGLFWAAGARHRRWVALLGPAWFLILLLPVLPLRDHREVYYLTLPALGLAVSGGAALARAAGGGWWWRALAMGLAGLYLAPNLIEAEGGARHMARRSWQIRTMVLGVARIRQMHPHHTIVLADVAGDLFWEGVYGQPFRALGISGVYLTPEAERDIPPHPEWGKVSDFTIPAGVLRQALIKRQAYVYRVEQNRMRAVTLSYFAARKQQAPEEPHRVDVGDPAFAHQLGAAWYQIHEGHRWMGAQATVRLRGPATAGEKLRIAGWCPAAQVRQQPLELRVAVDGQPLAPVLLRDRDALFEFSWPLPDAVALKPSVVVSVEVPRTFSAPPDRRPLGLVFGTFEIGP